MANYFLFGAIGQCPQCGDHRFSGPALLAPDASVTCHKCGHVCTVEAAVNALTEPKLPVMICCALLVTMGMIILSRRGAPFGKRSRLASRVYDRLQRRD